MNSFDRVLSFGSCLSDYPLIIRSPAFSLPVCCRQAVAAQKKRDTEWEKKELARLKREKKKEKREKEKKEAQELAFLKEQEESKAEYHMYGNR